jgi:hypothetical protein
VSGFDYTERIDPAALKAAGCQVVFRYLSNPGWPKNLTAAEARELLAAGIPIVLNYETTADFMLGGYSAGVACARSARQQAAALGAPADARIFYSADFDASPSQTSIVVAFLNGAASVDGASRVGVYGGLRVVQSAAAVGYATWQTIAWSGGQWDSRAAARQTGTEQSVGGVQVDVNQIMNLGALGAWGATTTPIPNTGGTVPAIPPSIGQKWPEIAGEFVGSYDDSSAIIWADGGARAAALYARQARDAINALAARQAPPVDVNALANALAPHLTGGVDPDAVAKAVVAHLGLQVVAK